MGNCVSHQDDSIHVVPDEESEEENVVSVRQSLEIAPQRSYSIRQSMDEIELYQKNEVKDIINIRLSMSRQSSEQQRSMSTDLRALQPSGLSIQAYLHNASNEVQ